VLACRTATDFKCANNLCLPSTVKCDGYDHCGDGSDEADELCGAFVFVYTMHVFVLFYNLHINNIAADDIMRVKCFSTP